MAQPWASGAHLEVTWAQLETRPGQFDWRIIEQHPTVLQAVRAGKPFGLQIRLQGTAEKPTCPSWVKVPQVKVATKPGLGRTWPAVWSEPFQKEFPRFITALAQQYDGDPRLAYVVMTEGTAIPYTANSKVWDKAGYTVTRYSEAYKHMYQSYLHAFAKTPLVAAITRFGQESRQALSGQAEEQALRDLLDFAGMRGLHFLVPSAYTPLQSQSVYVRDEILLPAFRKYAVRSHLLLRLDPEERRVEQSSNQTLQALQQRWPEVSIGTVIFAR